MCLCEVRGVDSDGRGVESDSRGVESDEAERGEEEAGESAEARGGSRVRSSVGGASQVNSAQARTGGELGGGDEVGAGSSLIIANGAHHALCVCACVLGDTCNTVFGAAPMRGGK